jgi:probable HAF family extracellular repeat protein
MVNLGVPTSTAYDVSADGSIIVGRVRVGSSYGEAFRWTEADGMVGLGLLPGGDQVLSPFSAAFGVSSDGSVVVGRSSSADGHQAFRWTEADGMAGLGDLPGGDFSSGAEAVSPDGSIVVGFGTSASGTEAVRWTEADGMVSLGALPGDGTGNVAMNISADGSVIVGQSGSPAEAFRWTEANGIVGLGVLPDNSESWAMDVSADGSVIVGGNYSQEIHTGEAFIWDEIKGMRSLQDLLINEYGLDLTGWILKEATGISDDGLTIVGFGSNPDGHVMGWIAVLTPPDPVELLLGLAQDVIELNLQNGIENSLDAKLDAALGALEDINQNNDVGAINTLQAFINAVEAQRGDKIPNEADADTLIAAAQGIIDILSGT